MILVVVVVFDHRDPHPSGQFQQTFTLPAPINADRAEASTADGVLTLTLLGYFLPG